MGVVTLVLSCASLVLLLQNIAAAADKVFLSPEGGAGTSTKLSGEVLDYSGFEIRIRLADGKEVRHPGARVERIDTTWNDAHLAGRQELAAGNYRQALAKLRAAFPDEPRNWVRRQLLAEIVWCYRGLGDFTSAGKNFLILYASDPQTRDFDAIPLAWEPREPDPPLVALASVWIVDPRSPAAVLLGASHLLNTAQRPLAIETLKALERSADPRIAQGAQLQLWRTRTTTVEPAELDRWDETITKLPSGLQAGANFVLGRARARHPDQMDRAALAYLRVPILDGRDRSLAATALLGAGSALEMGGNADEARRIYRELVERYPDSHASREGQTRLAALNIKPAS